MLRLLRESIEEHKNKVPLTDEKKLHQNLLKVRSKRGESNEEEVLRITSNESQDGVQTNIFIIIFIRVLT